MKHELKEGIEVPVRFSEVDSLKIVWHGHYLKYFEDAREAFGRKYGLGYKDFFKNGFTTPIVNVSCNYKKPLEYGNTAIVEILFIDSMAAKLIFEYRIYRSWDMELMATGSSTQVFISMKSNELCLTMPDFFVKWKKRVGITE